MYSYEQAAKELDIKPYLVQKRCIELQFKLFRGRHNKLFINDSQMEVLKKIEVTQFPTGNTIEIIKVTETFYIYESKLNSPD